MYISTLAIGSSLLLLEVTPFSFNKKAMSYFQLSSHSQLYSASFCNYSLEIFNS